MKRHRENGFTLYELLITVVIVALIVAIGVPNLTDFRRNSRATALANDLHGSFFLARSEAARARQNVTICSSSAPFAATATCDGASFGEGWIVFVDADGDRTRDAGADETVLKAFPPVHETIHINSNAQDFSFEPTGLGAAAGPFIAMICDDRDNVVAAGGQSAARRIVVTPIGRSTIIGGVDTITNSIGTLGVGC